MISPSLGQEKETIILVLLAPEDKEMRKTSFDPVIKKLGECGYQVKPLIASSSSDFDKKLKLIKDKKTAFVWIQAHGKEYRKLGEKGEIIQPVREGRLSTPYDFSHKWVKQDQHHLRLGDKNLTFYDGAKAYDAKEAISKINKNLNNPPIWLDACYSGACINRKEPTDNVAAASTRYEVAPLKLDGNSKVMLNLLCDRLKTSDPQNLNAFEQADKNIDGTIDGKELETFIHEAQGKTVVTKTTKNGVEIRVTQTFLDRAYYSGEGRSDYYDHDFFGQNGASPCSAGGGFALTGSKGLTEALTSSDKALRSVSYTHLTLPTIYSV